MRHYRSHEEYLRLALKDPKEAALYLNAAAAARAHGLSRTAKKASLSRMGLYKMMSKDGSPGLKTFLGVLNASGLNRVLRDTRTPSQLEVTIRDFKFQPVRGPLTSRGLKSQSGDGLF